jgi:ABC-type transporter Mla MlaB component
MWKVNRIQDPKIVVLALSGRLESEHLQQLQEAFAREADGDDLALDLKDVRLVDQQVVAFLADCEAHGVTLRNCPGYIRDWIDARRGSDDTVKTPPDSKRGSGKSSSN